MAVSSKFFRIGVLAVALLAASLTIVLWGSSGAEPAAAAPSTILSKEFSVETSDGVSIHVSEKVRSGGTKKVPILLVHSLWTNSHTWDFPGRSVMNYLATNGYDVYALDLRGMGESERPLDYNTIGLLDRVKDRRSPQRPGKSDEIIDVFRHRFTMHGSEIDLPAIVLDWNKQPAATALGGGTV